MSFSRADAEKIAGLVREGQLDTATSRLERINDPRAKAMLQKLRLPGAADDEMTAIKQAIREKRYDDAEAMLVLSDHPDAEKLRERLAGIRGVKYVQRAGTQDSVRSARKPARRPLNLALFTLIAILVVPVVMLFVIPAIQQYINRVNLKLESVCRDKHRDGWLFDDEYTFDQLYVGCQYIAINILNSQGDEAHYCFDNFGETDKRFEDCLDEQNVYFYKPFIYQARDNPELLARPGNFPTPDLSR